MAVRSVPDASARDNSGALPNAPDVARSAAKSFWRVVAISGSALRGVAASAGTGGPKLPAGIGVPCAASSIRGPEQRFPNSPPGVRGRPGTSILDTFGPSTVR